MASSAGAPALAEATHSTLEEGLSRRIRQFWDVLLLEILNTLQQTKAAQAQSPDPACRKANIHLCCSQSYKGTQPLQQGCNPPLGDRQAAWGRSVLHAEGAKCHLAAPKGFTAALIWRAEGALLLLLSWD